MGTWSPAQVNPLHQDPRNTQCEGKVEHQKPISLQDRAQEGTKGSGHACVQQGHLTRGHRHGQQGHQGYRELLKKIEKQLHVEGQEETGLCLKGEHGTGDSHLFKDMSSPSEERSSGCCSDLSCLVLAGTLDTAALLYKLPSNHTAEESLPIQGR